MFITRRPYLAAFLFLYISTSLTIMYVNGGHYSRRVSQENETLSHDIKLELKSPVYKVKYHAPEKNVDRLVIIDAFGEGQSLLFRNDNNHWTTSTIRDVPTGYRDARIIVFSTNVRGDAVNAIDIDRDKGGHTTGLGTDGEIYSFVISGGYGHWISGSGHRYELMNKFTCTDSIKVEFADLPWVNRNKSDLYVGRLHYLWSVPADIIVSPLLLLATPFLLNYGDFP
jgi:hypothetical protein